MLGLCGASPGSPRKLQLCLGQGATRPQNSDLLLGEVLTRRLGCWRAGDCPHRPMWLAAVAMGVRVGSRARLLDLGAWPVWSGLLPAWIWGASALN